MRLRLSTVRLLAAALALAAVLAGSASAAVGAKPNGEAAKTADQVLADAEQAALGASAVHVSASGTDGGSPLSLDLHLVARRGGAGSISEGGINFDMVRIGTKAYFKGDEKFWRKFAGSAGVQLFKGRWLMAPAETGDLKSFTPLTDMGVFIKQTLGSHGKLENAGTKTYRGRSVIVLLDTSNGGKLYVSATGRPYPVVLFDKTSGHVSFDGWNNKRRLVAPKNPIDSTKLGK